MNILKQSIEDLFLVDDIVLCTDVNTFRISAIDEDQIHLSSTKDDGDKCSFYYDSLEESIKNFGSRDPAQDCTALYCFISEYLRRVEQARIDEEVDAMWRSAIVCQL